MQGRGAQREPRRSPWRWALCCPVGSSCLLANLGPPRCLGRSSVTKDRSIDSVTHVCMRKSNTKCIQTVSDRMCICSSKLLANVICFSVLPLEAL